MLLVAYLVLVTVAAARDITEEEYSRFPRLFHLDDYEACLARSDGLYCLGTFHVAPATLPHPTYELMQEYSKDSHNFNRTKLYRGYCVSARCGAPAERNASRRFERCAARWGAARGRGLRLRLRALHYCRTHAQEHAAEPLDEPQRVFVAVLLVFGILNTIGTLYDLVLDDDSKKSSALMSWSVRSNWRRLTATHERGDPRLTALLPVQGLRVLLLMLTIMTHGSCIHDMSYLHNPRFIEKVSRHPTMMLFLNGTSVVQIFVMISSFLLAYNLLLVSKDHQLSLKHLHYCVIKRVARIAPVYLLVVGFAATWWERLGGGPLWPALVGAESAVCRRKFWTHALFINNLVEPQDICLVQTWFIAVDMQLHVVGAALTLALARRGAAAALRVLAALAAAACALNAALAYVFHWQALLYFVNPETLRTMYHDIPSFSWLYMSPWGSLPACLVGLFLAHLHYWLQETGFKHSTLTWLPMACHLAAPLVVAWTLCGAWAREVTSPAFAALYAALERPVIAVLCALGLFGMFNGPKHTLRDLFAWRGWHAMGRMSLSVLMLHWCLNMELVAQRPHPLHISTLAVGADFLATSCSTYLLAVPLTLLVEMPVHRLVSALVF